MSELTQKTAKAAASKATSPSDEVDTQLQAIRDEVAAMAETMSAFFSDKMHAFGATAEAAAKEASGKARKVRDSVDQGVEQAEKALGQRVQDHPLQSILMAFGLGLLVSLLFRR